MRRIALLLLLLAAPASGQEAPLACTRAIEGAVSCMAGKLCTCRFDPGGTMTGRPPGHRWDCGVLRPGCGGPPAAGVSPLPLQGLPPLMLPLPDPRQQDPRYRDPRFGDPRYGDPRYGDPRGVDPRGVDPRSGNPRSADPHHGDPRYGNPRYADPRYADPRYVDPRLR